MKHHSPPPASVPLSERGARHFAYRNGLVIDSFAGGGGASLGIEQALGRPVDVAIDHDGAAITMHAANHPRTRHLTEDVWKANPREVTRGRKVRLLWASPDCKHFSRAKGGKPVEKRIRSLAWVVCKWAAQVRPSVIILENVREFADWGPLVPLWRCRDCKWRGTEGQATLIRTRRRCPRCESAKLEWSDELIPDPYRKGLTFRRWVGRLKNLGYAVEWRNLNAADFGAPTHRRRLFLVARCDGQPIVWPEPTHGDPKKLDALPLFERLKPWRTAAECIDWSILCPSIFDRKRPLAEATMRRIAMGIKRYVLADPQPFLVSVNHGDTGGRREYPLDEPLLTVQASARGGMALVSPILAGVGGSEYAAKPRSTDEPLNTVMQANRQAVVAAFLAKHFGGMVGVRVDEPLPTTTARGFLVRYFGTAIGQHLTEPLFTATSKDRFGLVTVTIDGEPCVIVDIGMRMLSPRELARAQGFPDSYILTGTRTNQVARIGNSVCPVMAKVLCEANLVLEVVTQ